jgi:hypothetical protein
MIASKSGEIVAKHPPQEGSGERIPSFVLLHSSLRSVMGASNAASSAEAVHN